MRGGGDDGRHAVPNFQPFEVFREVARRGGFDAVSARREWRAAAAAWQPSFIAGSKTAGRQLEAAYRATLLQYERHLTRAHKV
eukprot:364309-Chlamydomonas_euryale.AAC.4